MATFNAAQRRNEKGTSIVCTPGGDQTMLIVSEPELYKFISTSRKPDAARFERLSIPRNSTDSSPGGTAM